MLKVNFYPMYENLLVIGATSELFSRLIPKWLPYVKTFTCIGQNEMILNKLKETYPHHVEIVSLNLLDHSSYAVIESLLKERSFDGLIQLQGYGLYGAFPSIEIEDHEKIFYLNFISLVKIAHLFMNFQKDENKKKVILHAASLAGIVHCPFLASYSAAKAALIHFSETIRIESASHFSILTLCPKAFGIQFSARASNGKFHNPESIEGYTKKVVEAFFQALLKKEASLYCTIWDSITAKLYPLIPKKWVLKIFEKRILRRLK
ncbi:MAG: SDR family NAD(P)-dependent oxidoreductase [Chlamydiae bacterium]|nr:SDR family NAD(P)-dependent oxidoreductase [Chlamydiota bacterium]